MTGIIGPDLLCEAATVLFVAWLLSDAPAARAHRPPLRPLFLPPAAPPRRRAGGGAGAGPGFGGGELAALLDVGARSGARWAWNEAAAGALAVAEGLALSARGAVRAARERFLAAAALGGWTALEPAPAPRRARDCALGLLFAALHTAPAPASPGPAPARGRALARAAAVGLGLAPLEPRPGAATPRGLRGAAAGRELLGAGRGALLAAAERCFGLYADALGARIAREAARL
eukprot:tig00001258_g7823.t1